MEGTVRVSGAAALLAINTSENFETDSYLRQANWLSCLNNNGSRMAAIEK
jgi:hypothetical protein